VLIAPGGELCPPPQSMIPKKAWPRLDGGGRRFSEKIMLHQFGKDHASPIMWSRIAIAET
jgi:hypothetical protein